MKENLRVIGRENQGRESWIILFFILEPKTVKYKNVEAENADEIIPGIIHVKLQSKLHLK